jgi:hypothetical protein
MVAVQDNDVTQIDEKTNHFGMAPKFNWRGESAEGATRLFQGWLAAQAAAVGDEKTSVPVFEESIVHFRVGAQIDRHKEDEERRASHGLAQSSAMPDLFVTTNRWQGRGPKDLLFLLSVPGNQKPDSTKQGSPNQFVSNGNERSGARGTSNYFLLETGMLPKGNPIQANELNKESYESSLTVEAGSVHILSCLPGSDFCKLDGPLCSSLVEITTCHRLWIRRRCTLWYFGSVLLPSRQVRVKSYKRFAMQDCECCYLLVLGER